METYIDNKTGQMTTLKFQEVTGGVIKSLQTAELWVGAIAGFMAWLVLSIIYVKLIKKKVKFFKNIG